MLIAQLALVLVTFTLISWGHRVLLELEVVEAAELVTAHAAATEQRSSEF